MTKANPHIAAMAPYAAAKLEVPAGLTAISLAQNESAFPPSPAAVSAACGAMESAQLYPDPNWSDLRAVIADVHNLDPETILCGMGSMELISTLMICFCRAGSSCPFHRSRLRLLPHDRADG